MTTTRDIQTTDEQRDVISAMHASGDSLMVEAYAGCAKTTTLELAARGVRVPALALAFNKRIAEELQPRLPQTFTVKTINGLGHGAWARALPHVTRLTLDDRKLGKLVTQTARDRRMELSSEQWDSVRRLVSAVMQAGVTPGDQGTPLAPDTTETWGAIALDTLWMTEEEFEFLYDLARDVLERSIALARAGTISFDDQIYCSVCLGGRFPQFPLLFVDEAQDLSPLNHEMLKRALRADGRLVAMGDPKQAIYAFRGAHSESMAQIAQLRPAWQRLPLTLTFRCPKTIVTRQQEHAPGFRAWHTNAEGRFARLKSPERDGTTLDGGWTWQSVQQLVPPGGKLAVLCRNNGPLLSLAFKLIRQGQGVYMLGRDIGKGLVALVRKLAPEEATAADVLRGKILEWQHSETQLALANEHPERVSGIVDRAECLMAVLDNAEARDAGQCIALLERLFARESGTVTLSSIHRAKGLEWDCVVHLDPWRIPSKWAREAARDGDQRQMQQEWNLLYVCETRTRHTLVNADMEGFQA